MTPKQKAEELFDKMSTNNGDEYHHCTYYVAKKCALIAVDEILNEIMEVHQPITKLFWGKVKIEIEKL